MYTVGVEWGSSTSLIEVRQVLVCLCLPVQRLGFGVIPWSTPETDQGDLEFKDKKEGRRTREVGRKVGTRSV